MEKKNAWLKYDEAGKAKVMDFAQNYINYISTCKTERECVTESVKIALAHGYKPVSEFTSLKPGDKVFFTNYNKNILLFNIGKNDITEGLNILGSHIDSPRIDLKQVPLYEDTELAYLDTHYYGGIKKYQWVTIPLAMHGVVVKLDGTKVDFVVGEDENDVVVGISDLLIHLSQQQMQKNASTVIEGEDLNVLVGSMPVTGEEKEAVKANIINILKEKYGFEEDDFLSAEIEVVPAGRARHYGLDSSMIMGYGHDDRVCAYPSLMALLDSDDLERTGVCLLVDKEEIGSVGATGAHSKFLENSVADVLDLMGITSSSALRNTLKNSSMLSSDVSAAYDPIYASVYERKNSAYFGKGLVFNKYTGSRGKGGSNDASAEFVGHIRSIMENNGIAWQTAELGKVDVGGGGTIAYITANYGMNVIDSGVAVQNMHAPNEVISKVDLYEAYLGYKAFLKDAKTIK